MECDNKSLAASLSRPKVHSLFSLVHSIRPAIQFVSPVFLCLSPPSTE